MKERNNKGKPSLPCLKGGEPAALRWRDSVRGSRCAHRLAMTEAEKTCVSFRDQSADWSWESVIPLHKSKGERIATASVRTGFAMTGFTWSAVRQADVGIGPYGWVIDGAVCGGTQGSRPTEWLERLRRAGCPQPAA